MKEWDQKIFEELISDDQFVKWARGEYVTNAAIWNTWEKEHDLYLNEFSEAVRMVRKLRFRAENIQKSEIQYYWTKTAQRISQTKPKSGIRYLFSKATKIAAILLLPVLLVSGWLMYTQHSLTQKYADLLENKHLQNITVVAPIGARITVDLPDGSTAWLNSGSQLTYPVVFNTVERRVNLVGEAFFKVQKNMVPFFVKNLGPEIKVYGTEFNVNSYNDEDEVTVALMEGKVALDLNGKEEFLISGQVSVFDRKKSNVTIEKADVANYASWRDGKYIFRDAPLSSILRILQRQHNVSIHLLDPKLGDYRYNATINNESLEQILKLLSLSAPINYSYKHREIKHDGVWKPESIEISSDKTRIVKTKI